MRRTKKNDAPFVAASAPSAKGLSSLYSRQKGAAFPKKHSAISVTSAEKTSARICRANENGQATISKPLP